MPSAVLRQPRIFISRLTHKVEQIGSFWVNTLSSSPQAEHQLDRSTSRSRRRRKRGISGSSAVRRPTLCGDVLMRLDVTIDDRLVQLPRKEWG